MTSKEIMPLLLQVIKSWQVIAVTVAIVLYMFLVSYVARTYHRPRAVSKNKPQKKKTAAAVAAAAPEEVVSSSADTNEELGLEESGD
jgi:flagellar biosynthesis/type III secretory pathway M-ring protein FliF/YscJ